MKAGRASPQDTRPSQQLSCDLALVIGRAVLLLLVVSSSAAASPFALIDASDRDLPGRVAMAFSSVVHGDQAQLDAMERAASHFRETGVTIATGEPKLALFYDGVRTIRSANETAAALNVWMQRWPQSPTPHILQGQLRLLELVGGQDIRALVVGDAQSRATTIEQVRQLQGFLLSIKDKTATDPHWEALRLRTEILARTDGNRFAAAVVDSLHRHPNYLTLYHVATEYYLPIWGGNPQDLERWAQLASTMGARSRLRGLYGQIYWHAFDIQFRRDFAEKTLVDEKLFSASVLEMADADKTPANVGRLALFACVAGNRPLTKKIIDMTSSAVSFYPYAGPVERDACVAWANETLWSRTLAQVVDWFWAMVDIVWQRWARISI